MLVGDTCLMNETFDFQTLDNQTKAFVDRTRNIDRTHGQIDVTKLRMRNMGQNLRPVGVSPH